MKKKIIYFLIVLLSTWFVQKAADSSDTPQALQKAPQSDPFFYCISAKRPTGLPHFIYPEITSHILIAAQDLILNSKQVLRSLEKSITIFNILKDTTLANEPLQIPLIYLDGLEGIGEEKSTFVEKFNQWDFDEKKKFLETTAEKLNTTRAHFLRPFRLDSESMRSYGKTDPSLMRIYEWADDRQRELILQQYENFPKVLDVFHEITRNRDTSYRRLRKNYNILLAASGLCSIPFMSSAVREITSAVAKGISQSMLVKASVGAIVLSYTPQLYRTCAQKTVITDVLGIKSQGLSCAIFNMAACAGFLCATTRGVSAAFDNIGLVKPIIYTALGALSVGFLGNALFNKGLLFSPMTKEQRIALPGSDLGLQTVSI